jgi:hypothetical protein
MDWKLGGVAFCFLLFASGCQRPASTDDLSAVRADAANALAKASRANEILDYGAGADATMGEELESAIDEAAQAKDIATQAWSKATEIESEVDRLEAELEEMGSKLEAICINAPNACY